MKTYSIGDIIKITTGRLKGYIGKIENVEYLDKPINGNTYFFRIKIGLLKANGELDYVYDYAAEGDMEMYLRANDYIYNKSFTVLQDREYRCEYEANNKFKIIDIYNETDNYNKVVTIKDENVTTFKATFPLDWFYIPIEQPTTCNNINDDFLI